MAKRESGGVAMSGQICLKWNSFLNNIATSFESLWEEEGLVDVTLASDGQCLTAHKVILSASSPFFKKVFQTNPCQHPVIILQDVHFSELEAILIFIYKGEVNIEQKNLPALLKAAETLQIRGLSGSEIFAKESYKRLIDLERTGENDDCSITRESEECPEKRQKVAEISDETILETALLPCISRSASVSESTSSEICFKDEDLPNTDSNTVPNPVYHRLEMKIEPYEITAEELQKQDMKEELERLDTGQNDETQGQRSLGPLGSCSTPAHSGGIEQFPGMNIPRRSQDVSLNSGEQQSSMEIVNVHYSDQQSNAPVNYAQGNNTRVQMQPTMGPYSQERTYMELQNVSQRTAGGFENDVLRILANIQNDNAYLRMKVTNIEQLLQAPQNRTNIFEAPRGFPLNTLEEFDRFEQAEEAEHDALQSYLEILGGKNIRESLNHYLRTTMTNTLAQNFSWTGMPASNRPQKRSFMKTKLAPIFFRALKATFKDPKPSRDSFITDFKEALRSYKQTAINAQEPRHKRTRARRNADQEELFPDD